jgi:ribonuclease PH
VQATAEAATFSRAELDGLLDLAETGIRSFTAAQLAAVARAGAAA